MKIHSGVERGLQLLREGAPVFDPDELPEVAAEDPIVGEEREPARLHDVDSFMEQFETRPDYFVRLGEDSLDRAGLRTGDIVAVQRQGEAGDGDLVVARTGLKIVVRHLRRIDEHRVDLQPDSTNAEHETIRIDAQSKDIEIIGVVVGAIVRTCQRSRPRKRELPWETHTRALNEGPSARPMPMDGMEMGW